MAATDNLWMEFESQVSLGYLECVYIGGTDEAKYVRDNRPGDSFLVTI